MAGNECEKNLQTIEMLKRMTECKLKEMEARCALDIIQRQLDKLRRGEPLDEELPCELELRLENKYLKCLERKASVARKEHPDEWKIPMRISQLDRSNKQLRSEILHLRHDHELTRCRSVACYDYEDAMRSFGVFFRNNLYKKKGTVTGAMTDKLVRQLQDKVVSMVMLSEFVYLYKQFRPHPEFLIPVELRRPALERAILAEYHQARARTKALTEMYRLTAKDLRLVEETIDMIHSDVKDKILHPGSSKSGLSVCEGRVPPVVPSTILEIIEEAFIEAASSREKAATVSGLCPKKRPSPLSAFCAKKRSCGSLAPGPAPRAKWACPPEPVLPEEPPHRFKMCAKQQCPRQCETVRAPQPQAKVVSVSCPPEPVQPAGPPQSFNTCAKQRICGSLAQAKAPPAKWSCPPDYEQPAGQSQSFKKGANQQCPRQCETARGPQPQAKDSCGSCPPEPVQPADPPQSFNMCAKQRICGSLAPAKAPPAKWSCPPDYEQPVGQSQSFNKAAEQVCPSQCEAPRAPETLAKDPHDSCSPDPVQPVGPPQSVHMSEKQSNCRSHAQAIKPVVLGSCPPKRVLPVGPPQSFKRPVKQMKRLVCSLPAEKEVKCTTDDGDEEECCARPIFIPGGRTI